MAMQALLYLCTDCRRRKLNIDGSCCIVLEAIFKQNCVATISHAHRRPHRHVPSGEMEVNMRTIFKDPNFTARTFMSVRVDKVTPRDDYAMSDRCEE